jgi:hypothetical protein
MIGRWLQKRSSSQVRSLALGSSSILFAILVVSFGDTVERFPEVFQILLGALSLATFVTALEWGLLRWRAAQILGMWFYESASGNVGLGKITMEGNSLTYEFSLYRSREDAVLDRAKIGVVTSPHTSFEDGFFWVNYKIDYRSTDYPPREGCVVITLPANESRGTMTGYWYSTFISQEGGGIPSNSGELYFKRVVGGELDGSTGRQI